MIFIVRVGAYCIRPTNDHDNGLMNGRMGGVFIVRVGAYCIRPTNGHANGQMNEKMDGVSVRFYPMNQKSDWDWIHPASGVVVCGAYAIRPYTGDLKNGDFSIHSTTGVAVCGAYAVAPLHGQTKTGLVFGSFIFGESKIESELDSSDHRRGRLWGVCCCALHG